MASRQPQTPPPTWLDRIEKTAQHLLDLLDEVSTTREELHKLMAAADREGVPQAKIARVASLSRERVRQILANQANQAQQQK